MWEQNTILGVPQLNSRFSVPSPSGVSGVTPTGNTSRWFFPVRNLSDKSLERVYSLEEDESTERISR